MEKANCSWKFISYEANGTDNRTVNFYYVSSRSGRSSRDFDRKRFSFSIVASDPVKREKIPAGHISASATKRFYRRVSFQFEREGDFTRADFPEPSATKGRYRGGRLLATTIVRFNLTIAGSRLDFERFSLPSFHPHDQ